MRSIRFIVRRLTSRQVCFPLILSVATISMVTSLIEVARNRPPCFACKEFQMRTIKSISKLRQSREVAEDYNNEPRDISLKKTAEDLPLMVKLNFSNPRRRKRPLIESQTTPGSISLENLTSLIELIDVNRTLEASNISVENYSEPFYYEKSYADLIPENFNDNESQEEQKQSLIKQFTQPMATEKRKIEDLPEQTKGVIILTNYRSGSTFLGELFNQHSEAFYTFEPLYPFGFECEFEVPRRIGLLHNMMKCNFPHMNSLYEDMKKDKTENFLHEQCVQENFCFRVYHEDLCSPDICKKGDTTTCSNCGPVPLSLVNNKCRSRKLSVVKVIRLCDILDLEPITLDPSIDFKIIHLARDPRGIANSRLKIHTDWDASEQIIETCERLAHNVRAGRNLDWLKDRYKLVRYEDLATKPIKSAAEIFKFVGLKFENRVKAWVKRNTKAKNVTDQDKLDGIRANRYSKIRKYDELADPYSTRRDSGKAMQAWRNELPFDTIREIQTNCVAAMRSLGYVDFSNAQELLNYNNTAIL